MTYTTNQNHSVEVRKRTLGVGILLICLISLAGPCAASFITSTLAGAGPGDWAILIGAGANNFQMNGPSPGTVGNVGFDGTNGVNLNGSAGPEIHGNLFLADGQTVNDATQVEGIVESNQSVLLSQDLTDAINASSTFAALAPTESVPGGAISGTTTINGTAGVNVINISSLNLGNGQTLTLNGPAGAQFIINDSGNFVLNSGKINIAGGISVDDVVINVTGPAINAVQTSGGLNNESVVNGILLALNSGIAFAPALVNGELIAGQAMGSNIQIVSGANVNGMMQTTPEPSTYLTIGGGLLALGLFRRKRTTAAIAASRD